MEQQSTWGKMLATRRALPMASGKWTVKWSLPLGSYRCCYYPWVCVRWCLISIWINHDNQSCKAIKGWFLLYILFPRCLKQIQVTGWWISALEPQRTVGVSGRSPRAVRTRELLEDTGNANRASIGLVAWGVLHESGAQKYHDWCKFDSFFPKV